MNPQIQNNQDYLAEKFQLMENYITDASKIALLKVRSWKFAMDNPEVGTTYQKAAEDMVKQSLLNFIPNTHVLSEEGYYFASIEN